MYRFPKASIMYSLNDTLLHNYVNPFQPINHLGISKYISKLDLKNTDILICEGNFDRGIFKYLKPECKLVTFEAEHPNGFAVPGRDFFEREKELHHFAHKIYTICPFSAEWLNKIWGGNKYSSIFFPIDVDLMPVVDSLDKCFDVIYTGNASREAFSFLEKIFKFNYAWISGVNATGVTHLGVSYLEKLKLVASSRISIVHNRMPLNDVASRMIRSWPKWDLNEAFRDINSIENRIYFPELPQIKSRVFEAALCGSLILCLRDKWNIIERFFKPNVDFLYYDLDSDLEVLISDILTNYDQYFPLIENAQRKVVELYSTEEFVKKIFRDCSD